MIREFIIEKYLPDRVVTNQEIIDAGLDSAAAVLERSLGVKERREAERDETGADMLAKVAKKILKESGCLAEELDLIICCADPGDAAAPDTATAVQIKIGAQCPAYGVSMSCTGWVAGIDIALRYLATGKKKILVIASSLVGSRLYYHNLMHRAIFGDGAGGILLDSRHLKKILATDLWTNGQYYSKIFVPYSWSKLPEDIPLEYSNSFYMTNDSGVFFKEMDTHLIPFVDRLLDKAKIAMKDIDVFLMHYPSKPLFNYSLKILGIPESKTFHNFKHYGNLVAAEMPVFLSEAIDIGRIKKGDIVLILPYGAGFTMGGIIMEY